LANCGARARLVGIAGESDQNLVLSSYPLRVRLPASPSRGRAPFWRQR
jgi:hypothetical protein